MGAAGESWQAAGLFSSEEAETLVERLQAEGRRSRLGVTGNLKRTLESTTPCESMIEIVRRTQRNVKRWVLGRDGVALDRRWHARSRTAVSEDHRLPRPPTLVIAIERDHDRRPHSDAARTSTRQAAIVAAT
jgi:hypothetical protein